MVSILRQKPSFINLWKMEAPTEPFTKLELNGRSKKRLSATTGTNDADFSKDKNYFILNHSDVSTPTSYHLYSSKKRIKEIKNNKQVAEKLNSYNLSHKVFSELNTENGTFNMWMLKPANFDSEKKYPLLLVQYSGPGLTGSCKFLE